MIYEYNGNTLNGIILLFFYSGWSKSCIINEEILRKLDKENNINIYKVNTTKYYDLKKKCNVTKIPSYAIMKNGCMVSLYSGAINKKYLNDWLAKYMVI